jgi:hypothetical protein
VEGQRVIQAAGDVFLEWTQTKEHDYYLGQFRDMKISAEVEAFPALWLGTHHAGSWREPHTKAGDTAMLAGYLGSTDKFDALAQYSPAYGDKRKVPLRPFRRPFVPGPADGTRTGSRSGVPAIAEMRMSRT